MRSPADVLHLQGSAGNRAACGAVAVQRLVPPDPTAQKSVRFGAKGAAVEEIQQHLNRHGAAPPLVVDGGYGPLTSTATKAFQSASKLNPDGVIGPLTWRALQAAKASPLPAGATKHPRDEIKEIFAKGAAMTPVEADRAQSLLLTLEGEEFRETLKQSVTDGSFMAMLSKLDLASVLKVLGNVTSEVVVTTTLLKPATDVIATDFKRANEIYNPQGIEIEQGVHIELSEKATKQLLGGDTSLDEFPSVANAQATAEELKLVEMNRHKGRIAAYWVPTMTSSRGEAILKSSLSNLGDDRESVVVNAATRAQDTFPHELGHALGLDHDPDANNLMADGSTRKITGAGIDKLTPAQLATIRASLFTELGRKGVGK